MPVCAGITSEGERCRRWVRNGTHCFMHPVAARYEPPLPLALPLSLGFFTDQDIENVNSDQRRVKLAGLGALNKIRSDEDARAFLNAGVLRRVIDLALDLDDEDSTVRDRALWVLINLTSVPGDTGSHAVLRERPDFITTVAENLVLETPTNVINLLWCLGNMAGSVPDQAIAMLDAELQTSCIDTLKDPSAEKEAHKNAAFLLTNLAPHTSQLIAREIMTDLAEIPPVVLTNLSLLVDLFWAMNRLYLTCRHAEIQTAVLLANSLDLISNKVVRPAIEIVADICASNDSALIFVMVSAGLLKKLHAMLYKPMFSPIALLCLSNIACEINCIPRILEMPGLLLDLLTFADRSRDAIWTVCNLTSRGDRHVGMALLRCGAGAQMLRRFNDSIETVQIIIMESVHSLLSKCGAVAWAQLRGGLSVLPASHGNPQIADLLVQVRRLAAQYDGAAVPAAAVAEPAEPDVDPRPLSVAVDVAAARMTEALARADGRFVADISDLVFTGADVAHLVGLGYRFRADGTLAPSTAFVAAGGFIPTT